MDERNIKEILKEGEERIKKITTDIDKHVRDNPWPFFAGVAVVALFTGFLMGKARKD